MSSEEEQRLAELERRVAELPGSTDFVELAKILGEDPQSRPRAREICFRGLNESPKNNLGRLQLAKLFYMDNLGEFAVRELIELSKYSSASSIQKLLDSFGPFAKPYLEDARAKKPAGKEAESTAPVAASEEAVIAEFDLDAEFTDALEELESKES